MRVYDILHFLKQIFFPEWAKQRSQSDDSETVVFRGGRSIFDSAGVIGVLFYYWRKRIFSLSRIGALISIFLHAILFILLSLFFFPLPFEDGLIDVIVRQGEFVISAINSDSVVELIDPIEPIEPLEVDAIEKESLSMDRAGDRAIKTDNENKTGSTTETEPISAVDLSAVGLEAKAESGGSRWERSGFQLGGGLGERSNAARNRLFANDAAGKRGEDAIEAALEWFVAHQDKSDSSFAGSWSFDFSESCGRCRNSGTHKSRVAATAIVTLAFLGAGYTHEKSPNNKYQKAVDDALYYLVTHTIDTDLGGALNHGLEGMYSHGIATIALCEAAAMQKNSTKNILRLKAQDALRFIENAQDRIGGGWRYKPNESGDISVTAWQVMALKSGKIANLNISGPVLYKVNDFLDSVEFNGGRKYYYLPIDYNCPITEQFHGTGGDSAWTCSATGLLLRMYLTWEPGSNELDEGVNFIAKRGPLRTANGDFTCNLYYAYYGTLLMHHFGESYWDDWYKELRDFLVKTQSKSGHESGSWFFPDSYCDKGGRLFNTALAVLILETPYRYLPLYRKINQ
ncbi:MAG: terpene cyclase/mutase family protein [Planctomycetaceae bacterium]|nr:terpene cyclase/mutase family protein [Planctomycetaceae bacterium]